MPTARCAVCGTGWRGPLAVQRVIETLERRLAQMMLDHDTLYRSMVQRFDLTPCDHCGALLKREPDDSGEHGVILRLDAHKSGYLCAECVEPWFRANAAALTAEQQKQAREAVIGLPALLTGKRAQRRLAEIDWSRMP